MRCHQTMLAGISLVFIHITGILGEEYGSYDHSRPPFHYMQSKFACASIGKRIEWDTLTIEVHSSDNTTECGVSILHDQNPDIWSELDNCLNSNMTDGPHCMESPEYGVVYQFDTSLLTSHDEIIYPCAESGDEPEITAIHIIYACAEHHIHEDIMDDILTLKPKLPPLPSEPGEETTPSQQQTDTPTDEEQSKPASTDKPTPSTTTSAHKFNQPSLHAGHQNGDALEERSHAITANELAMIVGPSVTALVLVILAAIIVFLVYKRRQYKGDLQGESLFNSRRFSTASQLSEVSINNQPFRVTP